MSDELIALLQSGTWDLVPSSPSQNMVGCKWIFRIKHNPNSSISRYKAGLVAKGFHQRSGLDFHDTFSSVVKPTTIPLLLSLVISHGWPPHQLDINNAFLHDTLIEDIFMVPRAWYNEPVADPEDIFMVPRAWYNEPVADPRGGRPPPLSPEGGPNFFFFFN